MCSMRNMFTATCGVETQVEGARIGGKGRDKGNQPVIGMCGDTH